MWPCTRAQLCGPQGALLLEAPAFALELAQLGAWRVREASWAGVSSGNRESKPIFPDIPWPGPARGPHPRPADAPDWAPGWREQLSLGFGGADRSSSCHGPPGHCGPCPSGTLGHTLYRPPCPHTQSLSSQLHFIILTKSPPKVPAAVSTVPPTLVLTWPIQDGAGPRASDPFPDPQPPQPLQVGSLHSLPESWALAPCPHGGLASQLHLPPRPPATQLTFSVTSATLATWARGP